MDTATIIKRLHDMVKNKKLSIISKRGEPTKIVLRKVDIRTVGVAFKMVGGEGGKMVEHVNSFVEIDRMQGLKFAEIMAHLGVPWIDGATITIEFPKEEQYAMTSIFVDLMVETDKRDSNG